MECEKCFFVPLNIFYRVPNVSKVIFEAHLSKIVIVKKHKIYLVEIIEGKLNKNLGILHVLTLNCFDNAVKTDF